MHLKKTKLFWLFYIIGGLFIIASFFFTPMWNDISLKNPDFNIPWRYTYIYALKIIIAAILVIYCFVILFPRLKMKAEKPHKITFIIEFCLVMALAILELVHVFLDPAYQFLNILMVIGLVMWIYGTSSIISAYFYTKDSKMKYPFWFLLINILFVSISPIIFYVGIKNPQIDKYLAYVIVGLILLFGILCIVIGILSTPKNGQEIKEDDEKKYVTQGKKVDIFEDNEDFNNLSNKEVDDGRILIDDVKIEKEK